MWLQVRIKAGITPEQLAQRLGVSQAYVSQLETRSNVTNKMPERYKALFMRQNHHVTHHIRIKRDIDFLLFAGVMVLTELYALHF